MKTIIIAITLIVLSASFMAQVEDSKKGVVPSVPVFYYDILSYKGKTPEKSRVDVYVEVPYQTIQFIRSVKGFSASYSVTLSIFDEDKKLITEKTWIEAVNSKDFESTLSKNSVYISVKSFELEPAGYFVRCQIEDLDSKKNFIREDKFVVRDFSTPVNMSDVLLVSREIIVNGEKKVVPNISRNIMSQKEGLSLFFEVYSDTPMTVNFEYYIVDEKKEKLYNITESRELTEQSTSINFAFNNGELSMGQYSAVISLKDEAGKTIMEISKQFESRWVGVPQSVKDLDKAVDQMVYIAKDSEIDHINDAANKEEKLQRYLDYWKQKDPSPVTEENEVFEEYYRRILYSNEHFKHYLEGWRTDMGMIYVTLGPPSNVERHPFEYDSKPFEVWDYYDINRRFIFVDETGFGDYRLTTPVYGNWWRYRQ